MQRETAFFVDVGLVRALDDHGVHDHARPFLVGLEDEETAEHPDLGRCQPDALRLVHERGHAFDEPAQVVVEVDDLVRDEPQRRIAVLADLPQREAAACFGLRFGARVLVGLGRVLVVVLVVVVLVVVVVVAHGDAV